MEVGALVGAADGLADGALVGVAVGAVVGVVVGHAVGAVVGCAVGHAVGTDVGDAGVQLLVSMWELQLELLLVWRSAMQSELPLVVV